MDPHDDLKFPDYFKSLEEQRRQMRAAQARKGQPAKCQHSRDEIIMHFLFQKTALATEAFADSVKIRSSFLPPSYHPCVKRLSELKKTMITDLRLDTHHRGQYLLLRTVTETYTMTAVMGVVEDENGEVIEMQLCNYEKELSGAQSLGKDTVLIVKEPYVKTVSEGEFRIRVDHPSDVLFIPEFDELVPLSWRKIIDGDEDSSFWKAKGNYHFKQGDHRSAIECYTKCLATHPSPELTEIARLNRALSYLNNGRFEAALKDSEDVLRVSELSEKALFRKGQALYHLRRFRESLATYATLKKAYPRNTMAAHEFSRAFDRLMEQEKGAYDFSKMSREAMELRPPIIDHATYIGPIAIKATESHGRGLFTTREVKAGDLLLCEKAFSYVFRDENCSDDLHLFFDAELASITIGSQAELIEMIAQKLHKNPSLLPKFADLYHGTYKSVDYAHGDSTPVADEDSTPVVDGNSTAVVDTFLVEKAILLNGFGAPLLSNETHRSSVMGESDPEKDTDDGLHSGGVWSIASYMNHSCMNNSFRSFIGDMMIVRASMDMAPDTEITTWYKSPLISGPEDSLVDLDYWGFKCDCILCEDRRNLSEETLLQRNKIEAEVQDLFKNHEEDLQKIEDKINSLADTYCDSQVPELELYLPCLNLSMRYALSGNSEQAVVFAFMSLESLGFNMRLLGSTFYVQKWGIITDDVPGCWMIISSSIRDFSLVCSIQAERYARISYKICVGEDVSFDQTYSKLSDRPDGLLEKET